MSYGVKTIAVVDDDSVTRQVLENHISSNPEYKPVLFDSGIALIEYLQVHTVHLILLDIEMGGMSGIETFDKLKNMQHTKGVPIVFLTGNGDRNTVLKCIGRGADGYMVKPVGRATLLTKIEEVISKYDAFKTNKTILMIDDDAQFLKVAKQKLSKYYKVFTVTSGKTALEYLANHNVDLITLDYFMPLYDGKNILNILKLRAKTKNIPVIMLSSLSKEEIMSVCSKNPPDGAITKSVDLEELLVTMKALLDKYD